MKGETFATAEAAVDPELGRDAMTPCPKGDAAPPTSSNTWLTKRNIMVAGALGLAAIVIGVAVGVPVSQAKKRAAEAAAAAAAADAANEGETETPIVAQDEAKPEVPFVAQASALPFRFAEQLQPMGRQVMAGYDTCGDLVQDVQHALESLANEQIEQGRDLECWWDPNGPYIPEKVTNGDATFGGYHPCPMADTFMAFDAGASSNREQAPNKASTEDSYGTNNQVDGVDEADLIKSNGEFVFMGYDRELVVIDLNGTVVDRVDVPLPPNATQLQPGFGDWNGNGGNGDGDGNGGDIRPLDDESAASSRRSINFGWGCGPPQPQYRKIRSLLLTEEHTETNGQLIPTGKVTLNVITTFDDYSCDSALCGGLTTSFIYEFHGASSGAADTKKLSLVASQDINGSYNNARGVGATNHLVTNARIDTWKFTSPLYRCDQAYWNMTFAEYEQAAIQKANDTVADFAKDIVKGLSWADPNASAATDTSCRHVVQISSMTSGDSMLTAQEKRSLNLFYGNGVLQNFVQITSLDLEDITPAASGTVRNDTLGTGLGTVKTSASGAFLAQFNPQLYATASDLVLAGRGWRYDVKGRWDEYTFLMSFDLATPGVLGAVPRAIGEVTGYLKDQFSMDVHQDYLRVATTSNQKWDRVVDQVTNDTRWVVVTNSTSQVAVLEDNDAGLLEEVGFVGKLGPGEDIKSVRFLGDRGYVVTFRTVDPLYSLDLSVPKNPKVMGELKISGFSEYMHPISDITDANSVVGDYLLTVGKEADEANGGRITGTKLSVFDVRNLLNPTLVADYVLDNGPNGWSSSDASYDHHAFRYLPESRKLIIPLNSYDWKNRTNNFDGFVVYDIDVAAGEISVVGHVTHSQGEETYRWCWGKATLPSRSMVFDGNLMTFKSHSIRMTTDVNNLVGDHWEFGEVNLDAGRRKTSGCHSYGPWMPFM